MRLSTAQRSKNVVEDQKQTSNRPAKSHRLYESREFKKAIAGVSQQFKDATSGKTDKKPSVDERLDTAYNKQRNVFTGGR